MTRCTTTFAIGLFAPAILGTQVLTACDSYCGAPPLAGSEQFDLGIDTDLHAVVEISEWHGRGTYEFLAVGAEGTVVVWSRGDQWPRGSEGELVVDVFDLGDLDLRAAWIDRVDWPPSVAAWWVVGDGGQIMVTNNRGVSWDEVQLQGEPDLYGIAGFAGRPIVVGDEIIAMRNFDGTWTELVPPADGWGSLRGIFADDTRIDVVGLGGVIWSTSDPNGAWTLEPTGVTTDLFAVDEDLAVGAQGTLLRRTETGWAKEATGYDVDLVDVAGDLVVGDDGAVYRVSHPPIERIQTTTQARAVLNNTGVNAWTTVGDDGWASSPPQPRMLAMITHTRALTLAMSLLATAAVSVALPGMSGCSLLDCDVGPPTIMTFELGVTVDLHAVSGTAKFDYEFVAVGAEGTVQPRPERVSRDRPCRCVEHVAQPRRAVGLHADRAAPEAVGGVHQLGDSIHARTVATARACSSSQVRYEANWAALAHAPLGVLSDTRER